MDDGLLLTLVGISQERQNEFTQHLHIGKMSL